jgi:hypothetical protein
MKIYIVRCFSVINKDVYKRNKDFASKFKGNLYQKLLYDRNLINMMHSLFLVKKNFDKIVFIGQNPEVILTNIPWSNYI